MAPFADPLFWLALLTLVVLGAGAIEVARGSRSLVHLDDVAPLTGHDAPSVSVVIPARNEERKLRPAIESVLHQRYPTFEVIAIDDRSEDRTGEILDELAREHDHLRVVHIATLEPGWLGKNRALQVGADAAAGDYILFADADVVLEPTALARAIARAGARDLDHLAAFPRVKPQGLLYNITVVAFGLLGSMLALPWRAADPDSHVAMGVGAFNLVRARSYRSLGGHRAIAMRPDDDLMLARLLKWGGGRSEFMIGTDLIEVEWYGSVREMVGGLMKNAFAIVDYRLSLLFLLSLAMILAFIWPLIALFLLSGLAWVLNLALVALSLSMFILMSRVVRQPIAFALGYPLGALVLLYIIWRAAALTLLKREVVWRDTAYPLEQLRANKLLRQDVDGHLDRFPTMGPN